VRTRRDDRQLFRTSGREADPTWEAAKADGVRVDTAVILHEV